MWFQRGEEGETEGGNRGEITESLLWLKEPVQPKHKVPHSPPHFTLLLLTLHTHYGHRAHRLHVHGLHLHCIDTNLMCCEINVKLMGKKRPHSPCLVGRLATDYFNILIWLSTPLSISVRVLVMGAQNMSLDSTWCGILGLLNAKSGFENSKGSSGIWPIKQVSEGRHWLARGGRGARCRFPDLSLFSANQPYHCSFIRYNTPQLIVYKTQHRKGINEKTWKSMISSQRNGYPAPHWGKQTCSVGHEGGRKGGGGGKCSSGPRPWGGGRGRCWPPFPLNLINIFNGGNKKMINLPRRLVILREWKMCRIHSTFEGLWGMRLDGDAP